VFPGRDLWDATAINAGLQEATTFITRHRSGETLAGDGSFLTHSSLGFVVVTNSQGSTGSDPNNLLK